MKDDEWVDIKPGETGSEDGEWVDIKPSAAQPLKPGSPTWAAIKGGIGGFFEGAWAGGNAAANKIVKALPEVGIGMESAIGHAARFAGKGLKTIGADRVGAAVESAGESIVGSAAGAKAWLDAKLPSEAKDWLGYEDWSTKASDWVGNAAAMAVKFAPGGAKVGGEAFMEAVFASDGANAFANTHDTAIENGASEAEASALGAEAALINYCGGKALMKSGGWAAGIEGAGKQFLASGAASSATMAAQSAGNKMVENLAERKPLMEGVAGEAGKGLVEGAMFHVYNAIPGYARGVVASREARQRSEEFIRGVILDRAKTDQGAARLALYFDGTALDTAIQARKAGKEITRKMVSDIGLPDVMTLDEAGAVIDAVSSQRRAWAERARVAMDDVQAQALAETVAERVGEDKALFESTWLKVLEKIEDAKELDDPQRREELVEAAIGESAAGAGTDGGQAPEPPERTGALAPPNPAQGGATGKGAGRGKGMDLLGKMDEGTMPVEDVAIGDLEGLAPSDTGKEIEEYDPAKAKPIVVWEDLEGNRHAVTGGKRLAMAGASGAETVKAVVIKEAAGGTEADGWTEAEARALGATENLREGSGTLKNVVEAVDSIGADGVAELAGWHQAHGSRDFASTIRRGLAVAQKGGTELKTMLAEGRIGEDFAYNAAQVLSMERVGEGWEAAQRELMGLVGKVGPEELEAVLWGLRGRLGTDGASGGPAPLPKDGSTIDWKAAIAEERAKYNAKKGGGEGKLDSDQVLIETADGELKTLGEIESEQGNGELGTGNGEFGNEKPGIGNEKPEFGNEKPKKVSVAKEGIEYREAKVRLDEQKGKDFSNSRTGISARLSSTGARKLISDAAVAKSVANGFTRRQHNEIAANVGVLFEDASLVESRPDKAGDINIKSIKRFITPIEVDGKEAVAWITVKESTEHGHRIYSVEGIKIAALSPSMRRALADRNSADNAASAHSVPNNLPRVNAAEAPELAAAEGAGANRAVELRPIQGRDGAFGTLSHPKARFTVDGGGRVVYVEGLTPEDFAPGRAEATAALVARIEAYAVDNGLKIGIGDDATLEAWARMRENIKREGKEAFSRKQMEARRNTVVDRLTKSGLATEVVQTKGDFDRLVAELNGRPLTAGEQVYGFCDIKTGKVYLNPDFFETRQGLDAPLHEFGHLGIIAAEKVNKAVYDRGMKLAEELLEGGTGVAEIVDFILNDEYYSKRSRQEQAEELLAQLIGKRGEAALRAETNKTVVNKIKSWLVEFWNTFGKALGLKDITPEEAAKMTIEQVADAIRAEMTSGRKYGEGLKDVEFTNGGARVVTKPVRMRRKLTGRRKAVNEFVNRMGGAEDPTNIETDLLALWVDNGGRLFDAMPYEIATGYSKGASGVKKTRRAVADEFAESTAFYKGLDAAQRKVFFGSGKLEPGSIGEGLRLRLADAGITRFTNEDGTVDFEGLIDEFKRQWTNYERGEDYLKERNEWQEERDRAFVEEMERAEQAAYDEMSAEEAAARAEMEAADEATAAQIAADLAAGRFSRGGIFTGTAADYANRSRQGGKDDGPSLKKIGTGEGNQVYGWGLYGSTKRGVAERYARIAKEENRYRDVVEWKGYKKIGNRLAEPPTDLVVENALSVVFGHKGDITKAIDFLRKSIGKYGPIEDAKTQKTIDWLEQHGSEINYTHAPQGEHIYEQTFFTNRAPGDESHLLKWYEPVSKEQLAWIKDTARKEGISLPALEETLQHIVKDGKDYGAYDKGEDIYDALTQDLGSPQAASEFLARAGIDGVKYPVDSYGGKTVKDGDKAGWNYVSFRDDNIRVDHKWTDGQLRFSRAVKPSALGDGKQRYYEVPFDKAVDKIVKNKKPLSRDHVFVGETPKPFADIGFARLPVMMGQGHVISCYFGEGEGVEGKHLHKMKGNLKLLPQALEKPLMIITSESSPSDSVVAILKMKDNTGASVIVPVKMSGVGRAGAEKLDAHIALTMFGKKNAWKSLVANALEKEANGEVGVFYIDGAESKTILERLGEKAKGLGVAGLQSPGETKAHAESGNSALQWLQSPRGRQNPDFVHSIADEGSPVKGGIVSQTATRQFKRWFANSKVVDRSGNPRIVYHGTPNGKFWTFDKNRIGETWNADETGFFFTSSKSQAEEYTRPYFRENTATPNLFSVYLSIQNPLVIDRAWWQKQFGRSDIYNHDAIEIWDNEQSTILDEMRKGGHDGVIIDPNPMGGAAKMYMVPEPNQIKSATDNIGTFDPGNADIRFARSGSGLKPPEAELVKTTRVADDAGVGERTPGAIAASRELSRQGAVPLTTKGTRYVSLPLSEMNALARYLTGHAMPGEMESGRKIGAAGKASMKNRKLMIAADVLGTIDKSDMAAEKATLKQHGYFAHEDAQWAANHSPEEMRAERERSDAALSSRLEALADRRAKGKEPGGQTAATRVYADQLAKIVMTMPHGQPGVLGAMQTVAGALEKRVRGNEAEAEAFLDWMNGSGGPAPLPRDASTRKAEMFAAFLMMPKEMETRAKGWYDAIRSTIAGDKKLAAAFREMTVRMMTEQGYGHLQAEIMRAQDAQTEAALKKLNAEANEPIAAGGLRARVTEAVVLSCDDRMGAAMVRVNAATRNYLHAQKLLMNQAKTAAERAAIKQQTDIFIGEIAQAKNQVELSRTAWERGHNNTDARYLWRVVDILNEATVRDGLKTADISLYMDMQRVIETKGLSGSRGMSARQAQIILDTMKKRLGGDYARIEAFAQKFHAIHEQELLNDPALERVLGKGAVEYWKSQAHYVTTKRQFSPEELAEIEAARRSITQSATGMRADTVIGQMYKYAGRPDATAKLKGSFADKQEVMSATLEKVAAIKKWVRKNDYVIELRDLLMKANVEGVHDFAAGKNEFPDNSRYGSISYMENGQKRTLVVPSEIAHGFRRQSMYDNAALKLCAGVNNIARQLWIDWNPVYWQRNIARNAGSIEMNMPGMREAKIKRGLRLAFPGLAPVTEMAMTHLVRHMPERWSLPLRRIWGEHTALFLAPKAKRMAMWLTDHNEMQRRLWDAERRGDLGTLQQMEEDRRDMLAALRGNMLVGISAGKASGTTGFLDDSVKTVGKTMQREALEAAKKSKWRKALDTVNIFEKNAKQQVFEDIMAKFTAYLHDRAQFGKTHNRTAEESGLMVKKNVSIGEGERKGGAAGTVQALMQPFWNMVEKGVVRNAKAYGERTGETLEKAAWRIAPMILHGLIGSGAVAAWILKKNDGDEEKVKAGPMGDVYDYLRDAQRAYQNCSNYVRENYHVTPLMTDGYTSVILGMPLTDEERLLKPIARFVTDAASVAAGTKASMDVAGFMSDVYGTVAPDFKMAGAAVTLLDDTVGALIYNPDDYYTGGQKYDKDLHALRNENWGMRGRFLAAMGKRLWNDFGGRNVLPVDRAGVDNGLGKAPGWVAKMVNDIPIASPILRSFVKVQVGSPRRDAAEITEADAKRRAIVRICSKEMFEAARREKRDLWLTPERYTGMLEKWQQAYGLSPDELAQIEAKYFNAWRAYEGAQYRADGEREKFRAKAEKLGLDSAHIWLDWD